MGTGVGVLTAGDDLFDLNFTVRKHSERDGVMTLAESGMRSVGLTPEVLKRDGRAQNARTLSWSLSH